MHTVNLPGGEALPRLGLGTWGLGEKPAEGSAEIDSVRAGLDLGVRLLDTAEMYGDGGAEEVVGAAIAGRREQVFLVSKVLPSNASKAGTLKACERSLQRMRTDRIDLYLLHWRSSVPLQETLAAFDALLKQGKIRYWGVSNFDMQDMDELLACPGGANVATNQVLYNLTRRGIEFDLLPRCTALGLPVMAYSPIEQGRLLRHPVLTRIAHRRGATAAQVALAWVLRQPGTIAIPKSASIVHLHENLQAGKLVLDPADLAELDQAFPPPTGPQALEMI
ncbi:MAG: oxidoreductase [Paucimonas sp.]|nr:oxidoreductase [Paucimonas sp.]